MKPRRKIVDYDTSQLGQLHCDADGCGYIQPEASAWSETLIGKPCPACGANLLTRADYDRVERLLRFIDYVNRWLGPIFGRREAVANAPVIGVRIHGDQTDISIGPGRD